MLLEKEAIRIRRLTFSLMLIFLIAGCAGPKSGIEILNETDVDIESAEKIFKNDERLASVVAIFHEKELISGVRVKTFSRFHKKKIEKELTKELENHYKEFNITVSADSKFIHETTKMMNSKDTDKLAEKVKKLKSLMEEET